jgi:hypothetical protein
MKVKLKIVNKPYPGNERKTFRAAARDSHKTKISRKMFAKEPYAE